MDRIDHRHPGGEARSKQAAALPPRRGPRPLDAYGKGTGRGPMMYDVLGWDSGDYGLAHCWRLCPYGGELVVFVTEPDLETP
ncbi:MULTISPECIES: hypothetical protein [unclassified Streptomyces]|uniref:hypothetical protein n=1 Tax=unclassified Streptomyces TaxID=2593676 RepID=UPI002E2AAB51|nr:hypothetical protein [Streptomyces sp. NBC_00273]